MAVLFIFCIAEYKPSVFFVSLYPLNNLCFAFTVIPQALRRIISYLKYPSPGMAMKEGFLASGQRTAAIAIVLQQYGQVFVVGASGSFSSFLISRALNPFNPLISMKMTNAVIRKLITAVIKFP